MRLFHVSDQPDIDRFEPQPVPSLDAGIEGLAVWAVADSHLPNYLLPRDCPRICFRASATTSNSDQARFLLGSESVVAFEHSWLERVRATSLTLYEMPLAPFQEVLPEAGYWITRQPVAAMTRHRVDDVLQALGDRRVEVRILDDFWMLRDAVVASTLQFSIIRTQNAQPRS